VSRSSSFAIGAGLSGDAARIAARGPQMRPASKEPDPDVLVADRAFGRGVQVLGRVRFARLPDQLCVSETSTFALLRFVSCHRSRRPRSPHLARLVHLGCLRRRGPRRPVPLPEFAPVRKACCWLSRDRARVRCHDACCDRLGRNSLALRGRRRRVVVLRVRRGARWQWLGRSRVPGRGRWCGVCAGRPGVGRVGRVAGSLRVGSSGRCSRPTR